jgi:phosphoribosyl 1,2-cyclic phosphodiesterase
MRATVWGCRGSLAAPGPETVRYGGNTSCLEVRTSDNRLIIIDAGTGIRPLGVALRLDPPERIDILLTHLHSDHIEGLGFFGPIWDADNELHIWGPASPLSSLEEGIAARLAPPFFPIHLRDIPSQPVIHDVPEGPWQIGSATISAALIQHPGPTVGYRIEDGDRVLSYMSDHEPALGVDLHSADPEWVSGYALAYAADALFHDSQYTEEEYPNRIGWGHSSTEHVVTYAQLTKVRQLIMCHHDPLHSDRDLEAIFMRAKELWGENHGDLALAYEGMTLNLS